MTTEQTERTGTPSVAYIRYYRNAFGAVVIDRALYEHVLAGRLRVFADYSERDELPMRRDVTAEIAALPAESVFLHEPGWTWEGYRRQDD